MCSKTAVEQLIEEISALGRPEATERLLHFRSDFPMDFTAEYLARLPLERIHHLLLAAHLYQARRHRDANTGVARVS